MAEAAITRRGLNRATLARQLLLAREEHDPLAALARLGGLQAQEPRPAFLALHARVADLSPAALRTALVGRSAVRATSVRATLHLHTAEEFLALRAALAPALAAAWKGLGARTAGIDVEAAAAAARAALTGRPMTFNTLRPLLAERFPDADERALGYAVRTHVPLVMVPGDDGWGFPRDPVFALADEWLGRPVPAPDPAALIRRHLGAFGPATVADVQAWSGVGGLAGAATALGDELVSLAGEDGRDYLDLADAPRPDEDVPAPPRLLPEFDSLVLAHKDRTRLVSDARRPALVTRNLRVKAAVLVDGQVAGIWALTRSRRVATVTVQPFARLAARDRKALEAEAARVVAFAEPEGTDVAVEILPAGEPGAG